MTTPVYNAERVPDLLGPDGPLAKALDSYEDRPYQREMALEVARLLEDGGYLAVEAPTGIGKSLGYALPAALWARTGRGPIVVSTHTRALQDQLLHLEGPRLSRILGTAVKVDVLKGRANYLCRRRYEAACATEQGTGTRDLLVRLRPWAHETETGDLAECGERSARDLRYLARRVTSDSRHCAHAGCTPASGCYYKRARGRLSGADIVVVNHALLAVQLFQGQDVVPLTDALVIDEAHAFVRVALDHLTVSASRGRVEALAEELPLPPPADGPSGEIGMRLDALRRSLHHASQAARDFFTLPKPGAPAEERQRYRDPRELARLLPVPPEALLDHVGTVDADARVLESALFEDDDDSKHAQRLGVPLSRLREDVSRLRQSLDVLLHPDPAERDLVYWRESEVENAFSLHAAPLALGTRFANSIDEGPRAVVFTSATLAAGPDFTLFTRDIGLPGLHTVAYPSPFDFEAQAIALAVRSGPDPRSDAWVPSTARTLHALLADPGRKTMALFTSYRDLVMVRDALCDLETAAGTGAAGTATGDAAPSPAYALLAQEPGASAGELLEAFRSEAKALLLGTASFWEGVDLPGDDLEVLVLTRLPFGVPTEPRFAARAERMEAEGGQPFVELYLPEAVLRWKQGVGRLIRRRTDRGIVAVLDPRLLGKGYGRRFAEAIPLEITSVEDGAALAAKAARWWREHAGDPT